MSVHTLPASPDRTLAPQRAAPAPGSRPVGVPRPRAPQIATAAEPGSPHILIADDDSDLLAYLMLIIGEAGYPVQSVNNGRAALAACRRDPPALVISDVEMPEMDGLSLLRELRADPELAWLPVLLSSASVNEGTRIAALTAGADDYLDKPVADGVLLARIAGALRLRTLRQAQYRSLQELQRQHRLQTHRWALLQRMSQVGSWELDLSSGDFECSDECARILGTNPGRVAFGKRSGLRMVHRADRKKLRHAFGRAVDRREPFALEFRILTRDGGVRHVRVNARVYSGPAGQPGRVLGTVGDVSAAKQSEARLKRIAHHDDLTGLANRLSFTANLDQSLRRAKRHNTHVALCLLDLDRFKTVNDTLGHPAGDELLKQVAARLSKCTRSADTLARFGGDEFVVLINDLKAPEDAMLVASKMIAAIARPMSFEGRAISTSASIGIGLYPDDAGGSAELIRAADVALYQAKARGRNAVARFLAT